MDWYLHADDKSAVQALRHQIASYLERHCAPGSDTSDAALIIEELVGNAVRHAGGPLWVSLSWSEEQPTLVVRDLGPGFDPSKVAAAASATVSPVDAAIEPLLGVSADPELADPTAGAGAGGAQVLETLEDFEFAEGGRGLFLVSHLAPVLQAARRRGGGAEVTAQLPVQRVPARTYDVPRMLVDPLPTLEEARPEGGFGRESFLRALVVQLARAVEYQHGPDAADAAVAQVGSDVGGRMEEEFRVARDIVGRLSAEQMAECYIRLKHAIDGGFYAIEVTPERIVLGNHRCPFGEVVRYAPSLCQMTSSVFGGIAARNSDHGAEVTLEERIALGDPQCRVTVDLRPRASRPPTGARHYSAQTVGR